MDGQDTERGRKVGAVALAAVLAMAALLSVREIASNDIGYHLAYGEQLLESGRPVERDPALYPLATTSAEDAAPGPGCWVDDEGGYRFANANWLSQLVLALAYRAGGAVGLGILVTLVLLGLLAIHAVGLARLGLPPVAVAAALGVLAWILQWRLNPRPELLGAPLLSAQLYLLLTTLGRGLTPSRRTVVAFLVLQVLMVNLHSYFLLGPGIAVAFLLDALWRRSREDGAAGLWRPAAGIAAGSSLACLVNPWTWRLATLPVQTLLFLRANHVSDPTFRPRHPWSAIGEFHPLPLPWESAALDGATLPYHLTLAVAALGLVAALARGRIGHALVLLGAGFVATSMRRNVPVAALFLWPTALLALAPFVTQALERSSGAVRMLRLIGGGLVLVAALLVSAFAVNGTLYDALPLRSAFGYGFSRLHMPLDACDWLGEQRPAGRLWTDFDSSSNLHRFTDGRPRVPIVTNTWAYPPETMGRVLGILSSPAPPLDRLSGELGVEVVALAADGTAAPLVEGLAASAAWTLVHLDARHVVFLRTDGANRDLARRTALDETELAPADLAPTAEAREHAFRTCLLVGWHSTAIELGEELAARDPDDVALRADLGLACARRGLAGLRSGDPGAGDDLARAREHLGAVLEARPGSEAARRNLEVVERALGSAVPGG